jgi:hypothetical protein
MRPLLRPLKVTKILRGEPFHRSMAKAYAILLFMLIIDDSFQDKAFRYYQCGAYTWRKLGGPMMARLGRHARLS